MSRFRISQGRQDLPESHEEKLALPVTAIGLSVRICNFLNEAGVHTVEDLLNTTKKELLEIPNFGEKTLQSVFSSLDVLGFPRG